MIRADRANVRSPNPYNEISLDPGSFNHETRVEQDGLVILRGQVYLVSTKNARKDWWNREMTTNSSTKPNGLGTLLQTSQGHVRLQWFYLVPSDWKILEPKWYFGFHRWPPSLEAFDELISRIVQHPIGPNLKTYGNRIHECTKWIMMVLRRSYRSHQWYHTTHFMNSECDMVPGMVNAHTWTPPIMDNVAFTPRSLTAVQGVRHLKTGVGDHNQSVQFLPGQISSRNHTWREFRSVEPVSRHEIA